MTSAIGATSSGLQQINRAPPPQVKGGGDADGDNDGSKAGEVAKSTPRPISATVGNNINTTA